MCLARLPKLRISTGNNKYHFVPKCLNQTFVVDVLTPPQPNTHTHMPTQTKAFLPALSQLVRSHSQGKVEYEPHSSVSQQTDAVSCCLEPLRAAKVTA